MSLHKYYMLEDQINYLLPEEDLSTDEDDVQSLTSEDDDPILILARFSSEQLRDYGYHEETTNLSTQNSVETSSLPGQHLSQSNINDGYTTDGYDSEMEPCRPISRISLILPYDHSEDDCDSHSLSENLSYTLSRPNSVMSIGGYTTYYETDFDTEDELKSHPITKSRKKIEAVYGHIPGVPVGKEWKLRRQCCRYSVHQPLKAAIHGGPEGVYSMVLSFVYAVDDYGVEFRYRGEGGRDPKTKKLVCDQKMIRGNLALAHSQMTGNPIRVIRGFQLQNKYSPRTGYRYDGLYQVTQHSESVARGGFKVFMFYLVRCGYQPPPPWHSDRIELPWPSPVHQNTSTSEDEYPEKEVRVKRGQQRPQSSLISDAVRCLTPANMASENESPPVLELPGLKRERILLYSTPPHINPGFCFDSTAVKIKDRAVVLLERLDKDLDLKLLANPQERVNVSTIHRFKILRKRRRNSRKAHVKNRRRKKKKMLISERRRKLQ
ncbi:uncharacterized protein LOC111865433 isoform X2 [Cryptotermes secundus]|nr:uncharacterized protein LOC111865433 isoform X2 [Cryptotermes secundus]